MLSSCYCQKTFSNGKFFPLLPPFLPWFYRSGDSNTVHILSNLLNENRKLPKETLAKLNGNKSVYQSLSKAEKLKPRDQPQERGATQPVHERRARQQKGWMYPREPVGRKFNTEINFWNVCHPEPKSAARSASELTFVLSQAHPTAFASGTSSTQASGLG